jgi:transposase
MALACQDRANSMRNRAAVDDPVRFKSSRTVGAHFGLTPRRFQSGETDNPGRISHAGDADVRATLYAAANAMLMRSITRSSLKAWGVRLMKTKGRRRKRVQQRGSPDPIRCMRAAASLERSH